MNPPFDYRDVPQALEKVDLDDDANSIDGLQELEDQRPNPARKSRWHRDKVRGVVYFGVSVTAAFLILLAVAFMLNDSPDSRRSTQNGSTTNNAGLGLYSKHAGYHCGNTETTARNLGCRFDVLSNAWTPLECWDEELYDDMMQRYNTSLKIQAPNLLTDSFPIPAQTQAGKEWESKGAVSGDTVVSWKTHLISCTYAWQKVTRAALQQRPLDSWSASYRLAQSCGEHLVSRDELGWDDLIVVREVEFVECGLDREGMLMMLTA